MDYSEDNVEQPEKISLYNSGMAQIKRLDELWAKSHKYVEAGELTKWNWILDRIWCELIGDIPEKKDEDEDEEPDSDKKEKLDDTDIFNNHKILIGEINNNLINKKIKLIDWQRELYEALMEKEAFLRRLQNRLGKGTKLVDADEDMIE